jgi:UrcA family protein
MMTTLPKARLIRNTLLAVTAVTTMAIPFFASASAPDATPNIKVAFQESELKTSWGRQNIYERMQDASRKLCGSSNIRLTGSLGRSAGNDECYEGTLTAAVDRLDNDAISSLHNN